MDAPQTHEAKDALIVDDNLISIEDMTHHTSHTKISLALNNKQKMLKR